MSRLVEVPAAQVPPVGGRPLHCPAHGLRFDLATGCVAGVKGFGVATYAVEQRQGRCFIDLSRPRSQESSQCPQQQ
jgi:nitrite reductase/ring-hydroxylating ferredoxin subunit